MSHEIAKERIYNPNEANFKEVMSERFGFKILVYFSTTFLSILGYILIIFSDSFEINLDGTYMIKTGIAILVLMLLGYSLSMDKEDDESNSPLVKNSKNDEYHLNMATVVKKFLGSGKKSLQKENLSNKHILLSPETVKRMGAIIGTTGSGKTVQLKGMLEQQTALGGGWCSFDAKGTIDELKNIYALVGKYGRLDELFVLNFSNPKNTHSINFFNAGSAMMLKEIMASLIESSEDKWRKVDEDFIGAILKILVYKRDNENFILTFSEIKKYLTTRKLLDIAWEYRKVDDSLIDDFISYICTKIEIDTEQFKKAKDSDKDFRELCLKNSTNSKFQGVYEIGLASGNWESILTTLGSNYGNIFNASEPDVDLFEIVQNNKMLWIVLPTMESEETARRLGKLFLGIIKSVADKKIKTSYEPKIPFLFLLDEFGSFGIVGFGLFMSKARALGMSVWLYFQSISQLDVIDGGKGLERKQILNICNTLGIMKNNDTELAKELSNLVPEEVFLDKEYKEKKFWRNRAETDSEYRFTKESKDAFRAHNFSKLKDGEMYCFVGDQAFKTVSTAPSDLNLTYQKFKTDVVFPLTEVLSKERLKEELRISTANIFDNEIFYA
jgi:intracellular multiplication protein IcmO